ncbi:transcriptional regulator with XRE-family HTH domain [Lipingzhangella halophila]|uniref:Transcriptional regulator with XRE-family HTH domain n=1 Tax=Lipingzhangella halophila TaxID=1783352 RepID=A0A7W7W0T7_9ACTN|nr:helix-turn-helix transcriptional regulator [Lipingzhangella halophila]MBB4929956.1 transcriptional regulator with XRE-family HTH domain [Lipingzhangella halophila]
MSAGNNPTARRRRLGVELRRLRENAGMTGEEAAERMSWSGSKLSRIERGQVASNSDDIRDLLELYGVDEPGLRRTLVTLARESRRRGWWHVYGDVLPERFEVYLGLEPEASTLRFYQSATVPGLMQTESYTRALIRAHPGPVEADEAERRVELRLRRQELLLRDHPPETWVVLDEAVLHRPVGGAAVLAEQLEHLLNIAAEQHVNVQVLPYDAGAHAGLNGSFDILEFPESDVQAPRLVHLENLTNSLYIEKVKEVQNYAIAFDHLCAAALHPDETRDTIAEAAKRARRAEGF